MQPTSRFLDRTTPPRLLTLVLIAGIGPLCMNIFLPSLPVMAEYFGTDYTVMQLSVSAYLAGTAFMQLFIGPLSDRYGRRPVVLVCFLVFLVATVVCIFATTIEVFLAARIAQAVVIAGMVMSRAIVRDMVEMDRAASMIAYITMGMTLMPMVGPTLGGFLHEAFGWRASMVTLLIVGLLLTILVSADLGETNKHPSASFLKQFRAYPELFRSRRFWGYSLTATCASAAFFSFLGGGPYVSAVFFDIPPARFGFYFLFIAVGYMMGNFSAGRYAMRVGVNKIMIIGGAIGFFGVLLALVLLALAPPSPIFFFAPIFFVGVGNGLTLPTANAGIVSVRPHLAGSASGLGGAMTIGGGAALSVLATALLSPESGPYPLLIVMLVSSLSGVVASLYVLYVERSLEEPRKLKPVGPPEGGPVG